MQRTLRALLKKHTTASSLVLATVGLVLIIAGVTIAACIATLQSATAVQRFDPLKAKKLLPVAQVGATLCKAGTFGLVVDCIVWQDVIDTLYTLSTLEQELRDQTEQIAQGETIELSAFPEPTRTLASELDSITARLPETLVIQQLISAEQTEQLNQLSQTTAELRYFAAFLEQLSSGSQTWILLLQNSDELRATGGFPGSYLKVLLQNGKVTDLIVEDIYDADGQFSGFVAPPHGVAEYTSEGNGLRLPDANWNPDFPESAKVLLSFFAQSNRTAVSGIGAVTLQTAEDVLTITGPLYLPDYKTHLTAENISRVLRDERSDFFPGSVQKKFVLQHALTAGLVSLKDLSSTQQAAVLQQLLAWTAAKDIQLYAVNPDTQTILTELDLDGSLPPQPLIGLIESNVGINKANRFIDRTVALEVAENGAVTLSVVFTNSALPSDATALTGLLDERQRASTLVPSTGYANYQRLLIPPEYTLSSLSFDGVPITDWHDEVIETTDLAYRQIGFLIPVLPTEKKALTITIQPQNKAASLFGSSVTIVKQAGLPDVPYTLLTPTQTLLFRLDQDTVLTLE